MDGYLLLYIYIYIYISIKIHTYILFAVLTNWHSGGVALYSILDFLKPFFFSGIERGAEFIQNHKHWKILKIDRDFLKQQVRVVYSDNNS